MVLGVDYGTTNCVACYNKNGKYEYVLDESGRPLIPSVVCYSLDETFYGRNAVEAEDDFPQGTIRSSKKSLGTLEILNNELHKTSKDIAVELLQYIKKLAENQFKEQIEGIVITCPAYFNQNQRSDLKWAAEEAGFIVMRIINEPTSAALAYGEDSKINELVLVYDLGGGTFDVTLLQLSDDDVYHVLSTSGDTRLGGDDFDNAIASDFRKNLPDDFKPFRDFDVRLKKFAEEVKCTLNYKSKIKKTLRYCGTVEGRIYHHQYEISSDNYKAMINGLLLKTKSHVLNALNDANKKISGLSKIILVGGSTKSTFVRDFVAKEFNTKIYNEINPDLAVAFGAASLANSISSKSVDSAILIDVTPLSLGIETKGGILNKIIPRNTSIPASASQEFITAEDNQASVSVRIFQGERPLAKDNEFLGEFELSGFEKRPRGQTKIVIKFDIDVSGMITVTAYDKMSGIQSNVTLKPLSSSVNKLIEDSELFANDDKKTLEAIELNQLQQEAQTLMFSLSMSRDITSEKETYNVLSDDVNKLKVFINSLKNEQ